ncbi:glucosidase II beta subunit-like protein-domain-containing protein [Kalaharituber pfeilii]|nr:glucosidase II beta subunit-like protein-domain-containing protein [Kalaharituber pfeilii]
MMHSSLMLAVAGLSTSFGITSALFSVHDDILAFPQFQVSISDSYIAEEEAIQLLSSPPMPSTKLKTGLSKEGSEDGTGTSIDEPLETYEQMFWQDRRYLCSVPIVKLPPPMNATEKEVHRAQEEKELARATNRGWELLGEMEGKCLYFISGWWSYSFCHNREIRQFHQLPPQNGVPLFPPREDPETASYVLGRANLGSGPGGKGRRGEGTELQGSGELRYLVQKLGGGTICDITGKERRIEVQYHCNPSTSDRIGFVKEVSICCYLMVIYTPRLCNDVAFLPPREGRANTVECREILNPAQVEEWHIKKQKEEHLKKLVGEFDKVIEDGKGSVKGIDGGNEKAGGDKKAATGKGAKEGAKQGAAKVGGGKKIKLKGQQDEEIILVIPEDFFVGHDEL